MLVLAAGAERDRLVIIRELMLLPSSASTLSMMLGNPTTGRPSSKLILLKLQIPARALSLVVVAAVARRLWGRSLSLSALGHHSKVGLLNQSWPATGDSRSRALDSDPCEAGDELRTQLVVGLARLPRASKLERERERE